MVLIFITLCALFHSSTAEAAELGPRARVDEVLAPLIKRGQVIGLAVVVMNRRSQPAIFTYGEVVKGSGRKPTSATVFQIGSITKTFTGLLLAILTERKLVRLEDPLQKFVPPEIRIPTYNGREISLRDLATHTSALPRDPPMSKHETRLELDEMYRRLKNVRLTREPGRQYEYSNWGFGLLAGALVRAAQANNYQALVGREILGPLGLMSTTTRAMPAAGSEIAQGYGREGERAPFEMTTWPALDGAGALYSNAADMSKYLSFMVGLTHSSLSSALPAVFESRATHVHSPRAVGLGWDISIDSKTKATVISKTGGTLGFQSYIGFLPETGTGVVILGNSLRTRPAELARGILARLQNED